ncbi:LysR family transcriptional regulator [Vibrio mangrovi]|uniref:HTH-type transcriptional regulator DmlR n=1 Tax=Vibrio mangrovi TaxID=474394 RepID=A0A1Y6IXR1_9VIBR|nr:LysR family transcriptional regulator [Vibrio mangrovi]MDW6004535.1 LysR family transcriptional regulator [Vibrio mangrovi]SMS00823.1 HTH-type transcriptional regulator DmlR [Vibrio mangrovi]
MLDNLKRIAIFNKVVECGSFTQAGQMLGMAKSKVSEQISLLESNLNVRLLHRTTRKISLTTEGEVFYRNSQSLIHIAETAVNSVENMVNTVTGMIRIGTTVDVGTYLLAPLIRKFHEEFPNVNFDIQLEDGLQDPVEHNLDLVIRIGELKPCSLVGRILAPFELGMYASQRYLDTHQLIDTLEDLRNHDWVTLTRLHNDTLTLSHKNENIHREIQIDTKHQSNSPLGVISMIQQGLGIGLIANFLIKELDDTTLIHLFPEWSQRNPNINILYPSRKNIPMRTRLFINHLMREINTESIEN